MSNQYTEELTLFLNYEAAPPLDEVAAILAALDHAVRQFQTDMGHEGVSLAIRDVRIGSIKFWLGLAGVALPAAKFEADYPGTISQFLDLLRIGVVMTADATLPAYAKTFLGLCAKPVADGRAKEVTLGSSHDDRPGIRIDHATAVTIINYYYGAAPQTHLDYTQSTTDTGTTIAAPDARDRRPNEAIEPVDRGPKTQADTQIVDLASDVSAGRGARYRSSSTNVDWSLHETSTRDVLLGLRLDVGEQTGVIVGRGILQKAIGRPDVGDPATTDSERDVFEQAVRRGLVTDRPFNRTRFNERAITAMRLEPDDFADG